MEIQTVPEVGNDAVFNVLVEGGTAKEIITWNGGSGFSVGDVITLKGQQMVVAGDITLTVGSLEDNNASNMFLLNDATNIRNFTYTGLTGTKRAGGLYEITVTSANSFTVPTSIQNTHTLL